MSIRHITGKPIKFLGVGEKTTALEPFHPDRIASRILGMGDVLSLVEEVSRQVDQDKAQKLARKVAKGKGFSLTDFKEDETYRALTFLDLAKCSIKFRAQGTAYSKPA